MPVAVTSHREPEPLDLTAFERLGVFVLDREEVQAEAELSVALVSAEEIADLNSKYRNVEGPTDVLSFGCDDPCATGGEEPVALGDVIIAPEVAMAQAEEAGLRAEDELDLLLVHGILHILGYEHDSDDGAEVMRAREQALLDAWAEAR